MSYSAYVLTEDSRAYLLDKFKPKFSRILAHHVTVDLKGKEVPPPAKIKIVGYACNDGIEAAVVSVNDSISRIYLPGIYHITISCEHPYKPKDSNELLKNGFTPVDEFSIYAPGAIL